jgi:protein disulfide-isomerase A1
MKFYSVLSLLSLAACQVAPAAKGVATLTNANFDEFIKTSKVALVKFYAPWCGHCKVLAPEFEKAAETLAGEVHLAEIDCDAQNEKEICGKFQIRGYPTLKVFTDGVPMDYVGTREAAGIISYMKKFTAPVVTLLEGDKVQEFIDSDRVVIIGFGDKAEGAEFEQFTLAANKFRTTFAFGWSTDATALAKHAKGNKGIVLFKKFDDGKSVFTGSITEADISKFVETESIPLMDDIGPSNYQTYMESGLPLVYLFTSNADERKAAGSVVEPLAKTYKGKINFVHIDAVKFGGHAPYLNTEQKWPALVIHDKNETKDLKFPFPQDQTIAKDAIEKFFSDFSAGSLKPSFKSEAVPATNEGPVVTVVHSTYDEIVRDITKDVLLEIYAPWCGHCKKLAPIYEELGKLFPVSGNVIIAQFNGDANDLPVDAGFSVEGFPTLKLFKAGDNKVIDYHGGHTLEDLLKFLQENATNKIDVTLPVKEAVDEEVIEGDKEEL